MGVAEVASRRVSARSDQLYADAKTDAKPKLLAQHKDLNQRLLAGASWREKDDSRSVDARCMAMTFGADPPKGGTTEGMKLIKDESGKGVPGMPCDDADPSIFKKVPKETVQKMLLGNLASLQLDAKLGNAFIDTSAAHSIGLFTQGFEKFYAEMGWHKVMDAVPPGSGERGMVAFMELEVGTPWANPNNVIDPDNLTDRPASATCRSTP